MLLLRLFLRSGGGSGCRGGLSLLCGTFLSSVALASGDVKVVELVCRWRY